MSTCQISKISKSTCKQKINYDLKENQCQGCDFYLCKKHKPRHQCSKVKYQQQNEELKEQQELLLDTQQDQEQQETEKQNNNDYYSYNKDNSNNNVIEYIPYEKKDKCYSNKVIYDKYGKIDKNNLKIQHEPLKKKKININSECFYNNNIEEEKQENQNQLQQQIQEEEEEEELEEFQQQQIYQEQLQEIYEQQKQQFENKDDATCYEKYSYKQEINQKEIDNYTQQIADQQQKSWADNSYLKKKQIECYQNIDYRILLDEQKVKNNLHLPGKNVKDYNFKSKKQSSKYQKILPLDVPFPEEPYEIQQDYAHKIVDALDNPYQENVLIQTPSGTGKTLSLLCSTLAFLKKHRDTIKREEERYQIIYASKTIQQLNKVAKELKKTGYKLRSTILESHKQMCINADVKREFNKFNQSNFSLACQKACQSQRCLAQKNSIRNMEDISQMRQIIDIEDLGEQQQNFNNNSSCPYFNAKYNIDTYDVILVPYSTLLDQRKMQRLDGINKKKQIFILDEAHNILEEICNGRSYKLDQKTLEKVINYTENVEEKVVQIYQGLQYNDISEFQLEQQIQYLQYYIDNSDFFKIPYYQQQNLKLQIRQIQNMNQNQYINDQKKELEDILQSVQQIQATLQETHNNFISENNKQHTFINDTYKIADNYNEMIARIFQRQEDEIKLIDLLKNLEKVKNFVSFTKGAQNQFEQNEMAPFENVIFFYQQLLLNVRKSPQYYKLMAYYTQNNGVKFVLQCLDSSFALKILNRFVDSTYILTSSQLSPFNIFLSEFAQQKVQNNGMKFNTHQFDKHVMPQQNFMGRIVNVPPLLFKQKQKTWTCPQCKNINKKYINICQHKYYKKLCEQIKPSWLDFKRKITDPKNKEDIVSKTGQKQFEDLGEYYINILKVIKGGVLLVFPTFNHLKKCRNVWEEKSQYGKMINKYKKIFYQSIYNQNNEGLFQKYQDTIEDDGNAMFVVVSQSQFLDTYEFKDDLNRAMFIVGTPGMQRQEGFIKEKLQYLEKQKYEKKTKICEQEWFYNYTMREVNKNLGKIIAHKDDYGAVYLIDQFYSRKQTQNKIIDWAQQQMKNETDFDKLVADTKIFFSQEFKEVRQVQKKQQQKKSINSLYQSDCDLSTGNSEQDLEENYYTNIDYEEEEEDDQDFI